MFYIFIPMKTIKLKQKWGKSKYVYIVRAPNYIVK